jgi:hypothetical protein
MKLLGHITFLVASTVLGYAQPGFDRLPAPLIAQLHADYPGWTLIQNSWTINYVSHQSDTSKCQPNLVWGDFDGNGQTDYAFFLSSGSGISPGERCVVVYLSRSKGFTKHLLANSETDGQIADLIWISPKGSIVHDYDADRSIKLAHDSIDAITVEKASVTYMFRAGRFVRIITAD